MAGAGAGLAEQRERIVGRPVGIPGFAAAAPGRLLAADRAHFPGRPAAGDGLLLVRRDGVLAHASEEIVRIVVFAHVFETELPILGGAQPALRRPMRRRRLAGRPLATRQFGTQPPVLVWLDPDAVEKRRVGVRFHRLDY